MVVAEMEEADSTDRVPMEYLSFTSGTGTFSIDKEDESAFERFCELRISQRTIVVIGGIFFLSTSYICAMSLIAPKSRVFLAVIFAVGCLIRNPILMLMIYVKNKARSSNPSALVQNLTSYFPVVMNGMSVLISLTLGLYLIARVLNGRCESLDQLHMWSCNSEYDSHALPQESVLTLMFLPIVLSIAFKTIRTFSILLSWAIAVLSIVVAIILADAVQSLPVLIVYIPLSLIFLFEIHRQNVILFLIVKKQQTLLDENKKLADESQSELRFMIANMAHDLKTPLSAFMNGVESLSSIIADIASTDRPQCSEKDLVAAKDNIKNLFNVNNFMTMTVNRCIDYMKASKGIKLEPRLETINLQEVLSMPLNCMRDLQSRIAIIQKPIPSSVCSHIITDLQWFQENLFCLISNAVKYSSHGHIKVSVSLSAASNHLISSAILKKHSSKGSPENKSSSFHTTHNSYGFLDRLVRTPTKKTGESESYGQFVDLEKGSGKSKSSNQSSPSNQERVGRGSLLRRSFNNKVYVEGSGPNGEEAAIPVNDMLLIEVEDTGIGLSDEVKQTLFKPFKQAQRRAGGTGLGLYSLAKRVDALGGYYGVSNRRDGEQGSIFWFAVPYRPDFSPMTRGTPSTVSRKSFARSRSDSAAIAAPVRGPHEGKELGPRSPETLLSEPSRLQDVPEGKLRILLVDDSLTILKMTSNLLKRHGHVVDQEENGADALVRLEKTRSGPQSTPPYDVMLIDLNMPVMDGLEATKRLRETEAHLNASSPVPCHQIVFAFSANSDNATMQEAMEAGADDFITKPFSIQTFNEKIDKLIC